jgi:hypothetical protein
MVRNILILLLLGFLVWFGYHEWTTRSDSAQAGGGDYTCDGCLTGDAKTRFLKENSGETADGNSDHKNATARVAAEEAINGTSPTIPPSPTTAGSPGTSSMVPPSDGLTYATPVAGGNGTFLLNGAPNATTSTPSVPIIPAPTAGLPLDAPTHDSQGPNAPNGMRFSGSGSYQWYRQGDLTYRVDTTTGKSCIIYATRRQWRDPLVFNNGCGRTT